MKKDTKKASNKNINISLDGKTKKISGNLFSNKKIKNDQIIIKSGQTITGKINPFSSKKTNS